MDEELRLPSHYATVARAYRRYHAQGQQQPSPHPLPPDTPVSHSEMAASILRPFVSDRIYWIIKHHGLFQTYYYAHHLGGDRNARDQFKDHRWYDDAVRFCEEYDQNCFDPEFNSESLEFFEPMLRRVFNHEHKVDLK